MEKSQHTKAYTKLKAALRMAREAAGLTQAEVAERLGLYASFVSKVEAGERRLDVIELKQFCAAYGVELVAFTLGRAGRVTRLTNRTESPRTTGSRFPSRRGPRPAALEALAAGVSTGGPQVPVHVHPVERRLPADRPRQVLGHLGPVRLGPEGHEPRDPQVRVPSEARPLPFPLARWRSRILELHQLPQVQVRPEFVRFDSEFLQEGLIPQ